MTESRTSPEERWRPTLEVVLQWRAGLSSGSAAELRRCRSGVEVELHPEFHRLRRRLPEGAPIAARQLPMLVGLSSHLRVGEAKPRLGGDGSLASVFGLQESKRPLLAEARFQRLLAETETAALYPKLVRALRMVQGRVGISELWQSLAYWNDRTRRAWAYAYYERN